MGYKIIKQQLNHKRFLISQEQHTFLNKRHVYIICEILKLSKKLNKCNYQRSAIKSLQIFDFEERSYIFLELFLLVLHRCMHYASMVCADFSGLPEAELGSSYRMNC